MSIILANFGKYAISDCPFIFVCLFVSLLTHFWLIHFRQHLLYRPYIGLAKLPTSACQSSSNFFPFMMHSLENSQVLPGTPNLTHSLSQNLPKIWKINWLWPISIHFRTRLEYINVPNFRPFLPCVLQRMPGSPKILTRFTKPKSRQYTDCEQNLISSEGGQHTSARQISDHSLHDTFPRECSETPNDPVHEVKILQKNKKNQQTVTKI